MRNLLLTSPKRPSELRKVVSGPGMVASVRRKVLSEPGKVVSELRKVLSEPGKVVSELRKVLSEPGKVAAELRRPLCVLGSIPSEGGERNRELRGAGYVLPMPGFEARGLVLERRPPISRARRWRS